MIFDKDTLWDLRKQICLNSLYFDDYENSYDIDEHYCESFFEGYVDYLCELMDKDGTNPDYDAIFDSYDNSDNLWDWYCCHDEDSLPTKEELSNNNK